MKLRELQRLVERYVTPAFRELKLSRDLLVRWDGDPIVRGFVFDRSQTHGSVVRLEAFAQPLFIPSDVVQLSVGATLGEFEFDDHDTEAVMAELLARAENEGRAFLARVSDCLSLTQTVLEMPEDRMDPNLGGEIRASCMIWIGRTADAKAELEAVAHRLRDFGVEWEFDLLNRVTQLLQTLERSPDEARDLLRTRAEETARALCLPS